MKDRERSTPTKKLLLSFLGLGQRPEPPHYDRVRYSVDDGARVSSLTPLVQAAHVELALSAGEPFDEVVLLCTRRVYERWIESGLARSSLPQGFEPKTVPDGRNHAELWEIFEVVRSVLSAEGLGEVHVDLTHGFRVQPMVLIAAVDFARSTWARTRAGELTPKVRFFYGAYEPGAGDIAPIWDVTAIAQAGAWNAALTAVVRYGRGDDFHALASPIGRERRKSAERESKGRAGAPDQLAKRIKAFCDDLTTGRLASLFGTKEEGGANRVNGSAASVQSYLRSDELASFLEELPPLKETFLWLDGRLDALSATDLAGEDGVKATLAYAELALELERFAEAAAALRECAVSLVGQRLPKTGAEPPRSFDDTRKQLESRIGELLRSQGATTAEPRELLCFLSTVGDLRNDVEHLGFRGDPRSAAVVRDQLGKRTAELAQLVQSTLVAPSPGVPATQSELDSQALAVQEAFLNLSNHPVATWPNEQAAAALVLGLGTPVDLYGGMPTVPPTATEKEVDSMAQDLADRALRQGARGAHVAGDFTLTMALVRELQRRGVRCFAATSERLVSNEEHRPEGAQATREFRFVRWREYSDVRRGA